MNSDLVVRDDDGKIIAVRYEAANATLLNEFLKEHKRINQEHKMQEQAAMVSKLDSTVAKQERLLHSSSTDRSSYYGCTESERPSRPQQTCAIVGCESLKLRGFQIALIQILVVV